MNKFLNSAITTAAALAISLTLNGCGDDATDSQSKSNPSDDSYKIAMVPKGTTHEFWKSVHAGAIKAERELQAKGEKIELVWQGPQNESDDEEQIKIIESLTGDSKLKAIAIAPLHETSLANIVKDTTDKGIAVAIFDSSLNATKAEKGKDYVTFIATDNYNGGVTAAKEMSKLLNGKGDVIVLRYVTGSASTEARANGFVDEITKNHKNIKIISHNQRPQDSTQSASMAKLEGMMVELKKADGLYCVCEPVVGGALQVLRNSDLKGKLKLVGFDASKQLVAGLKDGYIHALVVQNPMNMGYSSVMNLVDHLHGKEVAKDIDTGIVVVTPANMNEPDSQEVLNPPLDKYLN